MTHWLRPLLASWAIAGLLVAPAAASEPKRGGTFTFAVATTPPTLDWHTTGARATAVYAGIYIWESLVAVDDKFVPHPMLAERWDVSRDGLTWTFPLRKNVKFHNGKLMTAEDVETGNTDSLVERLLRGELDLAIVSDPVEPKDCVVEPWLRDELALIVPPGHRWAAREAVAPEELLSEPFIMREAGSGTRRMLERYLEPHGWSLEDLTVALTLGSTEAVKAGVEAGAGVSIVSRLALKAELAADALRAIPIRGLEMSRTFNLVYPKLSYRKVVVETFLGFCRAVAGTRAAEEDDGRAAGTGHSP